ncbi:MAG: type IIA DNA topoisomerase subunit B [Lentisphaerae bacterium]|nr:type IIA DNA topoisomerase subunit B [Lentisphaerota bacterium]
MAKDNIQYGDTEIQTLSALEHIRLRPGMYIGRLGNGSHQDDGIYILLKEIIDNSVDEFIMGCGKKIEISVDVDSGRVSIRDYGRGIPLGKLIDCVSLMNTGGKYNSDAFQYSIGMNGVGTKAANALSSYFKARSVRDGQFREAEFSRGELISDNSGESPERNGTYVEFIPDPEKFPEYKFKMDYVEKRIWMYAYLNSGLSLYLNGERYYSANGLRDLLDTETGDERIYEIIHFRSKQLEFALTHSDNYGENSYSFVNGQYTGDGGTHLSAFKEGVLKGINEYSGKSFKADAIRDGMIGAVAVKVKEPVFESQTKNKLGNTDVRGPIVAAVSAAVADYLHKHKDIAETVIDKVVRNEQLHKQIQDVKKKSRETSQKTRLRIPKLKDCKYHVGEKWPRKVEPKETMIFLTEGDSAAGSLEKKRDVDNQAIFALRGKPKNAYGETIEMIYKNEELTFLMQALGVEDSTENLRYDKIILATDADVDGLHIRNLLLTFFLCFFEQLVLSGHLYVLETPLFRVKKGKDIIYCYNETERDKAAAELGKCEITRFKGLGEISPDDFGEFIGENMRLSPVTLDNMHGVNDVLKFYMGDNTPERKEYIMNNLEVVDYE